MFCNNCGEKIDDDAKICRYCGTAITQEQIEMNKQTKSYSLSFKLQKKKGTFIALGIVVIFAISAFSYLSTPAGKLTQARFYESMKMHSKAYDTACKVTNEKGRAYQEYTLIMMKGDYLYSDVRTDEIDDAVSELRTAVNNASKDKYLLKEEEQDMLSSISYALDTYESQKSDIYTFKNNINKACEIYSKFKDLANGDTFNGYKVKEQAENWRKALNDANNYYISIFNESENYYDSVLNAINALNNSMDNAIAEYGNSSSVYYTQFYLHEDYTNPYTNDILNNIEYNIKSYLVEKNFAMFSN